MRNNDEQEKSRQQLVNHHKETRTQELNQELWLPMPCANRAYVEYFLKHLSKLQHPDILELIYQYCHIVCYPVNSEFITYLACIEDAEYDVQSTADGTKQTVNNTIKYAVGTHSNKVFGQLKPQLQKEGVAFAKLKVVLFDESTGISKNQVAYVNESSEAQLPFMRDYWGRFPIENVYYFRTGEYKYSQRTPQSLAILVGQLHSRWLPKAETDKNDGPWFMYRCYTPDFMDGLIVGRQVCRFATGKSLYDVLQKFSYRDQQRVLNNEKNGHPLSYDESYFEMKNFCLNFDKTQLDENGVELKTPDSKRLKWARNPELIMATDRNRKPKNCRELWGIYRASWFTARSNLNKEFKTLLGQAWCMDLMDECRKEEPLWLVSGSGVPQKSKFWMNQLPNCLAEEVQKRLMKESKELQDRKEQLEFTQERIDTKNYNSLEEEVGAVNDQLEMNKSFLTEYQKVDKQLIKLNGKKASVKRNQISNPSGLKNWEREFKQLMAERETLVQRIKGYLAPSPPNTLPNPFWMESSKWPSAHQDYPITDPKERIMVGYRLWLKHHKFSK